jgi:hypothetical protein
MVHFLGTVSNCIVEQRSKQYHRPLWKHELSPGDLRHLASSGGGVATELDFCCFHATDYEESRRRFDCRDSRALSSLDLAHRGTLVRGDLEHIAKTNLRRTRSKLHLFSYKAELLRKGSILGKYAMQQFSDTLQEEEEEHAGVIQSLEYGCLFNAPCIAAHIIIVHFFWQRANVSVDFETQRRGCSGQMRCFGPRRCGWSGQMCQERAHSVKHHDTNNMCLYLPSTYLLPTTRGQKPLPSQFCKL